MDFLKTSIIALIIAILSTGCYFNNEEELYGTVPCKENSISYQLDVLPIITNNCYSCHSDEKAASNGQGNKLEGHDNLKIYVDNSFLLKTINHEAGVSPMPLNKQKLSDCEINTITQWINEGSKNN